MVSATNQHESAIGIHMSPPSWTSLPPLSLTPLGCHRASTSFGFPVTYNKFPLAICFTHGNIYVSMLLSQIIPPSSSPTVQKSVLDVSISIADLK